MANKKHPRFSRLRTKPKSIRKSRRLKNKKPPQTPILFPPVVNYKNSCDNLFNTVNKYIDKNTNNSKLIVQKRDVITYYIHYKNSIIYITRILKEVSKNTKTLEISVNNLRPEFSFGSVINSLSSSRFISYTQPNTYSGKKSEDDSLYRHILELPSPDGPWDNDELDQVEELELSHYTELAKNIRFSTLQNHTQGYTLLS